MAILSFGELSNDGKKRDKIMKPFTKDSMLAALATCSILASLSCGTPPSMPTGTFAPTLPVGPSTGLSEASITQETIYTPNDGRADTTNYILLYRESHGANKTDDQSPRR